MGEKDKVISQRATARIEKGGISVRALLEGVERNGIKQLRLFVSKEEMAKIPELEEGFLVQLEIPGNPFRPLEVVKDDTSFRYYFDPKTDSGMIAMKWISTLFPKEDGYDIYF